MDLVKVHYYTYLADWINLVKVKQFQKNSIYNQNKKYLSNYRNNQIGFIFQSYHLLPDLTVYENIILPSSILNNKNAKSTVSELIDIMDLGMN